MSLANIWFSSDRACAACGHNYSTILNIFYMEFSARNSPYIGCNSPYIGCWADGPLNIIDGGEIFRRWSVKLSPPVTYNHTRLQRPTKQCDGPKTDWAPTSMPDSNSGLITRSMLTFRFTEAPYTL